MKGVIFNLLEEAVVLEHGPDTWTDLIDATGVDGAFTSLGSYPDETLLALVDTAAAATGKTPSDVLRWFGTAAMPLLAERYGVFFTGHSGARSFILSVNEIIHPEVRKLYSGAGCPHFQFSTDAEGAMIIGYQSPRRLCALAEGFILGAAAHYGEQVTITHLACMLDGSPLCRIRVRWVE
ncbi:hypothetical protein ABIC16_003511 [Sphingomonas sp. PvP055]|uniref:heme NO-binding domain-containing protein n=1 Tax=Sphingomonas sp. PvP055 TaxID=3156391 RepID=UPI003391D368